MEQQKARGSAKLLAAWKAREITEDAVREIAQVLEKSPATVEKVAFTGGGGSAATGMRLALAYTGDDVPWCGNDLQFLLKWFKNHGFGGRPPRILINGIPFPDEVRLEVEVGFVNEVGHADQALGKVG